MLSLVAEYHYHGVRVASVADGLDSNDDEANLSIQIRGIFNELQVTDLRKKTLRGMLGQVNRGFSPGTHVFGYRSVPQGNFRIDKKGNRRPDGYGLGIKPSESQVVKLIFVSFARSTSGSGSGTRQVTDATRAQEKFGRVPKPKSEWIEREQEGLRIVSQEPWQKVVDQRHKIGLIWQRGGSKGFQQQQKSGEHGYPTNLFSKISKKMVCYA